MKTSMLSKSAILKRAIIYQIIGYGALLLIIFGGEVFDTSYYVFGQPATPINWIEAIFEGLFVVLLGLFTIYMTWLLLSKIKILEGFLPICLYCKKIRKGEDWVSLEEYLLEHSEALLSHGVCPSCTDKHISSSLMLK